MTSQTAAALSTRTETASDLSLTPRDREVLRRLATRVAELAARPLRPPSAALWYAHNALQATRPAGLLRSGEWLERDHHSRADGMCRILGSRVGDDPAQRDLLGQRDER